MRFPRRSVAGFALAVVAFLAGCGIAVPSPSDNKQGTNNVFVDQQGDNRCAYISESTKDVFCGTSGVDPAQWVSPPDGTIYNAADGFSVEELALGVLLDGWPQQTRPADADKTKVDVWKNNNPDFDARYAAANPPSATTTTTPTP